MDKRPSKILVVGAGISGIRTALDLAELGHQVGLIDKAPAVGGILAQLDRQFPNNHCGMCRMLPMIDRDAGQQFCLRKGLFHDNIELILSAEILSIEGNPVNLTVTVSRRPSGVDHQRCTGCGVCETKCPVEVADAFNAGLGKRKAVYLPVPHQIPNRRVIDWDTCTLCGACRDACPTGSIDLNYTPVTLVLEHIPAVILATGVELFDPGHVDLYGAGHLPNVVTATAFERILSGSGPYQGRAVRPSDGKAVKKVAWIQCVGSRNVTIGADYCSSACCMFAIKEAVLAVEKIGKDARAVIFYMDLRTFGRDFQRYRDRAENKAGVRFVRCRVHSIEPAENNGDVCIGYVDASGILIEEIFDLVVLSTGRNPTSQVPEFAGREGVYTLDSARDFLDIAGAVISAGVVSENVNRMLSSSGIIPAAAKPEKLQTDVMWEAKPHLQIVLCTCGDTLNQVLEWDRIETELENLPGKMEVARIKTICDQKGWDQMTAMLRDGQANRLLLAACNPLVYLPRLKALEAETEISQSLMEIINLRSLAEQTAGSADGTRTVLCELEMGVQRLIGRKPEEPVACAVSKSALIVGGGPAGLAAAISLAAQGVQIFLVEKTDRLGGNLSNIREAETRQMIEKLVAQVQNHPLITVHYEAEVMQNFGRAGCMVTRIRHKTGAQEPIMHGAAIVATGGQAASTRAYLYGEHAKIITLFELEERLAKPEFAEGRLETVVFIQCVDSREEPRNYCSRICCLKSLKAAIAVRNLHPQAQVYVFYRDIMTYGDSEKVYTQARRNGVWFIPYELDRKPQVRIESGRVMVAGSDPVLGEPVCLEPDLVALATGIVPNPVADLTSIFNIHTTCDGFVQEADSKWRPVDTGREGIFICGLARGPARADEAVNEGKAAAQRALRILSKDALVSPRQVARVRHAICSLCETCLQVCPYQARYADPEMNRIQVDPAACQGCGVCAAECPNSATMIENFEEIGIMAAIEAAL
ncbi:MAG: FAD-dependent oxidoreductase [Pseudomonadota bacterium]